MSPKKEGFDKGRGIFENQVSSSAYGSGQTAGMLLIYQSAHEYVV